MSRAVLQPVFSQFILVPSVIPSQVQNLAPELAKFCPINYCPVLQSM